MLNPPFDSVLAVLVAYLLGSVSGSLLLGRLRGVDIRTQGSGNAGGTNAFRTQGLRFALGVVLIDIGKGAAALWLARQLQVGLAMELVVVMAAVCGHVWPLFHGFRGGKGAATLVGGLLLLWPAALAWVLGTWLLVLALSGYVGLATIIAAWVLLPLVLLAPPGPWLHWLVFSLAVGVLISFTHRANLQRLAAGNEHRFDNARLLHRWFGRQR